MNDDTISRQAAIDALKHFTNLSWDKLKIMYPMLTVIEELPSAERHGRWIKDKNLYKCTACNDLLSVAGWADCIPKKQIYRAFKYCPNCGAKMNSSAVKGE